MSDKRMIAFERYFSFKISPNNLIWAWDSRSEMWYCLSPAGEYWSDDGETELTGPEMGERNWPEVRFEVTKRKWKK